MPRYIYRCNSCNDEFETFHSISDRLEDRKKCNTEGALFRVPSFLMTEKKDSSTQKVGSVVKSKIEEFKQEVSEEKQALKEREYK